MYLYTVIKYYIYICCFFFCEVYILSVAHFLELSFCNILYLYKCCKHFPTFCHFLLILLTGVFPL